MRFQAGESFPCRCLSKMVYIRNSSVVFLLKTLEPWNLLAFPACTLHYARGHDSAKGEGYVGRREDIIILREFLNKCITDCIVVSLLGWHRCWWDRRDKSHSYIVIAISPTYTTLYPRKLGVKCLQIIGFPFNLLFDSHKYVMNTLFAAHHS